VDPRSILPPGVRTLTLEIAGGARLSPVLATAGRRPSSFSSEEASMTTRTAVAATLIVGLATAGCGGGKSKSTSSTSTSTATTAALSKPAFLKKGNAICKRGNREINAQAHRVFTKNRPPTPAQVMRFAKRAIPIVQGEINGVRALPAPAGDQAKVTKLVYAVQKDLDKVKANPALLAGKRDPFKDANKLAKVYGLTVCGSGG
jgi:hypothetical protein